MSIAPHAGIVDFGTFTPPSGGLDGIQGEVPAPLAAQAGMVLTTDGWAAASVKRTTTVATGASITVNTATSDLVVQVNTQAAGTLTINAPTGTAVDGQQFQLRLKCTNVQTFSWNAVFRGSTSTPLPTATTGGSKTDYLGFQYNSTDAKWDMLAKSFGF